MARGIDSNSVPLGDRIRLVRAHEGPVFACTMLFPRFESGVTCIDCARGFKAMVHRRRVQRTLCDNVMDKGEIPT